MNPKKWWFILKGTFKEFGQDNVMRLSAALAYYAMFSLGPLLVIAVGVAGLAFGHESVRHQIEHQLKGMLGAGSAKTLDSMMSAQKHGSGLVSTIVGIVALLFGAGGVFGQMQDALNTIWGVKAKPGAGIWALIRARFLSLSMVLGTGFLLLISMALTTFLTAVTGSLGSKLPVSEALAHGLNFVVSFAIISVLFAMIFKYLPDVKIPFRKVWVGAIGTALLFTIGKYVLGLYLGRESLRSSYGAAGSVVIILLWVYYASVLLFFGAEFTQVYAKATGAQIEPTKYAVLVTQQERAEEGMGEEKPQAKEKPRTPSRAPAAPGARAHGSPAWARAGTPGEVIHRDPWGFVGLMLVAGFAGSLVLRSKWLRKGLRLYFAS